MAIQVCSLTNHSCMTYKINYLLWINNDKNQTAVKGYIHYNLKWKTQSKYCKRIKLWQWILHGGSFCGITDVQMMGKGKVEVKCTLVQALRLCTGRTAHRGSRGIALTFHDHGTKRGWGVSVMPRLLFTPEDPVPIVQETGWTPGLVWTDVENLAPTRIQSPDRPACSQSIYRLRYLAHGRWESISYIRKRGVIWVL